MRPPTVAPVDLRNARLAVSARFSQACLRHVTLERNAATGGASRPAPATSGSMAPAVTSAPGRTGGRPLEQRGPPPRVRCEPRGPLELGPGLMKAAQSFE